MFLLSGIFPQNHQTKNKMENRTNKRNSRPKSRTKKRFLEVDVWQKQFGEVSVKAVLDIYSQKFNVDPRNMKRYSFSHCVNALRKLDNPDYIAPDYGSGV